MLSPRLNTIISSTARLNEYYLARESDAQRLYTVCHELGHGFGLPHWDEDFFNKDLGNCMDYTSNPSRNSKPDESNFLYLAQLYGGRNVTETSTSTSSSSSSSNTAIEESVPPDNGNRRRLRRRYLGQLLHQQQQQQQPSSRLLQGTNALPHHPQRRILHANDQHEMHMIGPHDDGTYTMQQYLLALPEDLV